MAISTSTQSAGAGKAPVRFRLSSDFVALVIVWALILMVPLVAPNYYVVSLVTMGLINVMLIASLNLLMGYGGQISLSHAGFFGLGAYASGVLNVHVGISPWLGLPAAAILAGLAAFVIGLPTLRLKGHYLSMATLGWNAILVVFFNQLVDVTGGPNGLLGVEPFTFFGISLASEIYALPLVAVVSFVVMLAILNLVRSRMGRGLRAVATNELGAEAIGIDSFRTKLSFFTVSAAIAGIAGSVYVHVNMYASPETFAVSHSILLIVMVAIGGAGSFWGPVLGALIYTLLPQLFVDFQDAELLMFGLGMLGVLIFFPKGLAGIPAAIRSKRRKNDKGAD